MTQPVRSRNNSRNKSRNRSRPGTSGRSLPAIVMPPAPVSPYGEVSSQAAANRRRAAAAAVLMPAVPALVIAAILGAAVVWWLAPMALVVITLLGAVAVWRAAPGVAMSRLGASPLGWESREAARLHNLVDGLCVAAGLPRPNVLVVPDNGLDALVVGPAPAALVVTSGLVAGLSRIEMEGVVAHLLSHIRRGDALVGAVATVTAAPVASLWPALGAKLTAALIDGREEPTDAAAVGLTKFPPGLASALEKMRDHPIGSGHPAVDPLWEVPPAAAGLRRSAVLAVLTANRVEDRIQVLREL